MTASLPPLIQAMVQPQFYPHPVQTPIRLLQTHISYVLLTGDYAYKVKKPADFGFLNFSTLERRHFFCQEELRLNQRLCPDLYLQVLGIEQNPDASETSAGAYGWSRGEGRICDYAIQMRQFDQAQLFSHLFAENALTLELMIQLGKQLAQFHAQAATSPDITAFGSPAAVQTIVENSYGLGQGFIGRSQTAAQFEATKAFTDQFFQEHGAWLQERQILGKIRECHGDIHLNNICLFKGLIQIFDCIEFNQEFRNIDVIYDAAFLVMDLQFRGRPDLANTFLNAYLEWSNDYQGAVLLPLYLSMRAYIRGNVNSLALNDPAIPDSDKVTIAQTAADYYHQAWAYTQPQTGALYVMVGISGSGKSTVARQIAQQTHGIQIRSDAVRKHLAGLALDQRGDDAGAWGTGIYTPELTQKTYDRLLELGIFLAKQGATVILDAKYDRQALRQTLISQASAKEIPLKFIYCTAPVEVLHDRLNQRQGDIADATSKILAAQIAAFEPFSLAEQAWLHTINTTQELGPQLGELLSSNPE
ncbi:AAA family ATPase [Thermosynechococcaceae cyanobacterium BACA0444]|uniref:gluconokinase n=1 Tax=Pseudocalidococcus azoricus BACA0444 TaxID=2918990 RepID=A0AAE4FRP9_9CYAN|nr:AAA family ATPase [Pseudocalidococcus azoricus]MDS3860930.1 AAA family ATPase [Pseudocalidococcus azoricus BACA0444]